MKTPNTLCVFFVFLFASGIYAQRDSLWNVLVLKKGNSLKLKEDMASLNNSGFYLYKNCVYEFELKNKTKINGRLVEVKRDSLFFTRFFNVNIALRFGAKQDTLRVHWQELDKIRLIADRALGIYQYVSMSNYDFVFKKDTTNYHFPSLWHKIYINDESDYEIVAHMTAQGINSLYESEGATYYYYGGGMMKPDPALIDDTYDKRFVLWYTPCRVEEVNGLAIGLKPVNEKNSNYNMRDSLLIRGVNLVINPFGIVSLLRPQLNGPYPDSADLYRRYLQHDWKTKIKGLNVSALTTIGEIHIDGLNITSLFTTVDELNGLSLSGLTNFSYYMRGVEIAALRNRATTARGVQIGLFNKANDLRGFQIGLWNVNGRRSLPFINWQFRENKKVSGKSKN